MFRANPTKIVTCSSTSCLAIVLNHTGCMHDRLWDFNVSVTHISSSFKAHNLNKQQDSKPFFLSTQTTTMSSANYFMPMQSSTQPSFSRKRSLDDSSVISTSSANSATPPSFSRKRSLGDSSAASTSSVNTASSQENQSSHSPPKRARRPLGDITNFYR